MTHQISETQQAPPPTDDEIQSWRVKKLKEYVTTNTSINITNMEKHRLQFIAMDCIPWTFDRISNLNTKHRGFFIEKDSIKSKLTKPQIEIYLNPSPDQTEQRTQIINSILQLLTPPISPEIETEIQNEIQTENHIENINANDIGNADENKDENQERALVLNNDNNDEGDDSDDDMSSVSTHASMPSLMSDNESDESSDQDESESDSDDDNNELLGFDNEQKQKAIKPPQNTKKGKKKQDDFLTSGFKKGFLGKGKKKTKKKNVTKQGKKNKSQPQTAKKSTKNSDNKKEAPKKEEIKIEAPPKQAPKPKPKPKSKPKKEEDIHIGYNLLPLLIDANKDSVGELFTCIGTRKVASDLSTYKHIKCWISLKNKLKKKGKKKPYHFSVLIDLRNKTNLEREIERSVLKNGFENVLSFNLNPNHNIINHIQLEDNNNKSIEKIKINIEDAFMEYKDEFGILINEKFYTKSDEINEIESIHSDDAKKDEIIISPSKSASKTPKSDIDNVVDGMKDLSLDISYITKDLMNACRLTKNDILLLLSDDSIDSTIADNDFYVRVQYGKSDSNAYRIGKINKTMHYPKEYKFTGGISTNKGFCISFGKNKPNKKFTKISNDDFNDKEIKEWIAKMKKDAIILPTHTKLDTLATQLDAMRIWKPKAIQKLKEKSAKSSSTKPIINTNTNNEPGASPIFKPDHQNDDNIAPLNAQTLAQLNEGRELGDNELYKPDYYKQEYLRTYIQAIEAGYHSFWMIPSTNTEQDSNHICFMLGKSGKNKPLLEESKKLAKTICIDIEYAEIREWTNRKSDKDHKFSEYYKAVGLLFDALNPKYSWKLYSELNNNLLPRAAVGRGYSTNFVRHVLPEFGKAFLRVQLSKNCPKITSKYKHQPQGPKCNYIALNGEPSIATMSEAPKIIENGEFDHTMRGDDDTRSNISDVSGYSITSRMSNKSDAKYDQYSHMKRPFNSGFQGHGGHGFQGVGMRGNLYKIGDKVSYRGKEYEVINVQGGNILIENDNHSARVSSNEVRKKF